MNITNRPVCINRALCSKSKSDKPNSFKWLHSSSKCPEYQTSLETCILAACEGNKAWWRPAVSWARRSVSKQMTTTRFFNCQSDIAIGTAAGEPEILYRLPRGKAFILQSDISGRVYVWVIIFDSVCVHQQAEQQCFCKTFQGGLKLCRSLWTWPAALWSQQKGSLWCLWAGNRTLSGISWA